MNKWQELMAGAVDFRDGEIARLKKEITAYKARAEAAEAREKVLSAPVSDGEIHNYGEGVDGEYLEDKRCYETRTREQAEEERGYERSERETHSIQRADGARHS